MKLNVCDTEFECSDFISIIMDWEERNRIFACRNIRDLLTSLRIPIVLTSHTGRGHAWNQSRFLPTKCHFLA